MRLKRLRHAWSKSPSLAAAVLMDRIRDAWEDCRLGMWTAGLIPIETLVSDWRGYHDYAPTSFHAFHAFMSTIRLDPDRDVFLDLGCGKGRVLVMAAKYPFRRIIGVEVAPRLAAVAAENVARVRDRRCHDVSVWTGPASEFPIPDEATLVYLFNPFHGSELEAVLDRMQRSLLAAPRRLQILFNNPVHLLKQIERYPWLAERERFHFEHECVLFEATP